MAQTTVKHDKTPLFSWEDLGTEQGAAKALKQITAIFARAGNKTMQDDEKAASAEISKVKRTSGVKYREIAIAFLDSQSLVLRIKESGDIFQVVINKKLTPIKNQDDQKKAVDEIIGILNAGRTKFQAAMAKKKDPTPRPPTTSTSKKQQIVQLTGRRDQLIEDIATIEAETAKLAA